MPGKIKFHIFILFVSCLILQITFVPYVRIHGVYPDLITCLFVLIILHIRRIHSIYLAFVIGMTKDVFTNTLFGVETIGLLFPALFIPLLVRKAETDQVIVRFLVLVIGSLMAYFPIVFISSLYENNFDFFRYNVAAIIFSSLYNGVIGLILNIFVEFIITKRCKQYELF